MRRVRVEVGEIDLVHRRPVGAIGHVYRALDDVAQVAARLFDQRPDVVNGLLRLRAHVAHDELPLQVAPCRADK